MSKPKGTKSNLSVPLSKLNELLPPDSMVIVNKKFFMKVCQAAFESGEVVSLAGVVPATNSAAPKEDEEDGGKIEFSIGGGEQN